MTLGSFFTVVYCLAGVTVSDVGMMRCCFMFAISLMLCSFPMVLGCLLMMSRCLVVMLAIGIDGCIFYLIFVHLTSYGKFKKPVRSVLTQPVLTAWKATHCR